MSPFRPPPSSWRHTNGPTTCCRLPHRRHHVSNDQVTGCPLPLAAVLAAAHAAVGRRGSPAGHQSPLPAPVSPQGPPPAASASASRPSVQLGQALKLGLHMLWQRGTWVGTPMPPPSSGPTPGDPTATAGRLASRRVAATQQKKTKKKTNKQTKFADVAALVLPPWCCRPGMPPLVLPAQHPRVCDRVQRVTTP